jgi:hypothetical protein
MKILKKIFKSTYSSDAKILISFKEFNLSFSDKVPIFTFIKK